MTAVPVDDAPIAAVATAPGRGAVGIVRVSGGDLRGIIAGMLPRRPPPRRAVFTAFLAADGAATDNGLALYFPAPRSFTGQEVLELQGHGGPGVLRRTLARCFELGARAAEPGEFSLRAYLNGKMDLAQAEAVADLVGAESDAAARAAMRSLTGEFSRAIHSAAAALEQARAGVEADMDFADEELGENDSAAAALTTALTELAALRARAGEGALLTEGVTAAIVGPPNVGKSSLLNRLCGEAAAIVAAAPGTTRDAVARDILAGGLRVRLTDTAGLREDAEEIEREGIRRARRIAEEADVVLAVGDNAQPPASAAGAASAGRSGKVILVRNKIDLDGAAAGVRDGVAYVSAKTEEGLADLRTELLRAAGFCGGGEPPFAARARQLRALNEALEHARRAENDWGHPELAADGLRRARDALTEITGAFDDEKLLGEIFSRFCIGK